MIAIISETYEQSWRLGFRTTLERHCWCSRCDRTWKTDNISRTGIIRCACGDARTVADIFVPQRKAYPERRIKP